MLYEVANMKCKLYIEFAPVFEYPTGQKVEQGLVAFIFDVILGVGKQHYCPGPGCAEGRGTEFGRLCEDSRMHIKEKQECSDELNLHTELDYFVHI